MPEEVRSALAFQADPQAAEALATTYRRWLATAETCLCRAADQQGEGYKGRGSKLAFELKRPAPGADFEHKVFKDRASSWWTLVVARLRDIRLQRRKGHAISDAVTEMCRKLSANIPSFPGEPEEAAAKE